MSLIGFLKSSNRTTEKSRSARLRILSTSSEILLALIGLCSLVYGLGFLQKELIPLVSLKQGLFSLDSGNKILKEEIHAP